MHEESFSGEPKLPFRAPDGSPTDYPEPITSSNPEDSIPWLIDRMRLVPEATQGGTEPITTRAAVLAQLHQAQALDRLAVLGECWSIVFGVVGLIAFIAWVIR